MASPVVGKAATPVIKDTSSTKLKQTSAKSGKSPSSGAAAKSTLGKSLSDQLAGGKNSTGQSGSGKEALGQSAPRKPTASPGSKVLLGQASPRKSIFSKAVGYPSAGLKLGSSLSPSKSPFTKGSPGKSPGSTQYDLPLALRKKRRPNAGMKRETPVFMDKIINSSKSPKDGKSATKRKLSQTSPNGSKMGVKNKPDYVPPSSKKRKIMRSNREQDARNDFYCWVCHKEGSVICCELCPRVYHPKCAKVEGAPIGDWFCPECERATNAECIDSQSQTMSSLSLDELAKLLLYALKRMKHTGAEPFLKPVNIQQNPGYEEFVFNPMDLSTLEKNIKKRMYGSTEAFLLDAKWILHNCIVFNGSHHKLTNSARMIIKICEYEMKEIETCPDCYLSASVKRDKWFCEVCRNPHRLVWARLQGFPFWPSKVIREKDGLLDVRFFGQHDRAWISINSCYMYSHEIPNASKKKTTGLSGSIAEMEHHIQNLKRMFGEHNFQYAPHRTAYGKYECLTLTPEDKAKWVAGRVIPTSLSNGTDGTSTSKSDQNPVKVNIKQEPVDTEYMERYAVIKMVSKPAQDKDASVAQAKEANESENDQHSKQEAENQKSTKTGSDDETDRNSPSDLASKKDGIDEETSSGKMPNVVRRQIFSITRKKTGGMSEIEKPPTKILDTLSMESSSKANDNNTETDENVGASPSKAPAGVFEVSDESLNVEPKSEVQSAAAQLLGKAHVSANDFARSLAIKLNKVSPRTLGKIGRQMSREDKGEEIIDSQDAVKQDSQCEEAVEKSQQNESDRSLENAQSQSELSDKTIDTSESLPSTTETTDVKNTSDTPKSTDDLKSSESTPNSENIPSTSKTVPTKDKFHIKLGKTIETMKAFLGIERLHSVDKEASDSESSAAESDSESSEAEHSDDSEMEVDGGIVNKNDKSNPENSKKTSSTQEKTLDTQADLSNPPSKSDAKSPSSPKIDAQSEKTSTNNQTSESKDDPRTVPALSNPKKSKVDLDIDLVMSCHSEISDSEEGGLVIDESQSENQPVKKPEEITSSPNLSDPKPKDPPSPPQNADSVKEAIKDNAVPMETDTNTLVSDPLKKDQNNAIENDETIGAGKSPPVVSTSEHETTKVMDRPTPPPKDTSSSPPLCTTESRPSQASDLPPIPQNLTLPSVDHARSQSLPSSSFPNIIETLQATKRPQPPLDVPTTTSENAKDKNEENTGSTDTYSIAPSTSNTSSAVEQSEEPFNDIATSKRKMYKKYVDKITSAVEGMLDDFSADFSREMPLRDAKTQILELKQKLKQLTWEREQEKREYKQILELAVAEMKECIEAESRVALANLRAKLAAEKEEEIRRTKTKQWCANCGKDAVFFCCWNTSYCDYPCQQSHWVVHRNSCQQRSLGNTVMQVQSVQNKQTSQPVPMQLHQGGQSNIQQHINHSANQTHHQVPMGQSTNQQPMLNQPANQQPLLNQPTNQQPLHQTLQQVQQVMQPPASSQPMQTLIQYVQAPRMSAPLPVRQLLNHNPFVAQGRMVGGARMRLVRP